MKASEAVELMGLYSRLWPSNAPARDEPTLALWAESFADLAKPEVEFVMKRLASDNAYPPNPLYLRKETLRRSFGAPSVDEAWLLVQREISRVGMYSVPRFEHPAVARAVNVLGWVAICSSDPERTFMLNDFRRVYQGIVEGALADEAAYTALTSGAQKMLAP